MPEKIVSLNSLDGLGRIEVQVYEGGEPKKKKVPIKEVMVEKEVALGELLDNLQARISELEEVVIDLEREVSNFKTSVDSKIKAFLDAFTLGGTDTHETE